jgi:hypothetical protein
LILSLPAALADKSRRPLPTSALANLRRAVSGFASNPQIK